MVELGIHRAILPSEYLILTELDSCPCVVLLITASFLFNREVSRVSRINCRGWYLIWKQQSPENTQGKAHLNLLRGGEVNLNYQIVAKEVFLL